MAAKAVDVVRELYRAWETIRVCWVFMVAGADERRCL